MKKLFCIKPTPPKGRLTRETGGHDKDCECGECSPVKIPETGFTKDEQIISNLLVDARNAFCDLKREHPSEMPEFDQAIHVLQGILAKRIVRRDYPKGWPIHRFKG